MSVSLAVKYRPKTLQEMVGQDYVVDILEQQCLTENTRNCYLFKGISGGGKTTAGRAFAMKLNNGQGTPIEIDAASNNGVDNIREIIKSANERALDSKYKVIIVDECFMEGTPVRTSKGVCNIEDIQEGDYVETLDGSKRVLQTHKIKTKNEHLVSVSLSNGTHVDVTKDHLFLTTEGWVSAKELQKGDILIDYKTMSNMWQDISYRSENMLNNLRKDIELATSKTNTSAENVYSCLCDLWEKLGRHSYELETELFSKMLFQIAVNESEKVLCLRTGDGTQEVVLRKSENDCGIWCSNCSTETEQLETNEIKQSNVSGRKCSKNAECERIPWDLASMDGNTWGKWTIYEGATSFIRELRSFMGVGVSNKNKCYENKSESLSYMLQSRPCLSYEEDCSRGGWQWTSIEKRACKRRKENTAVEPIRVESVESYKRGGSSQLDENTTEDTFVYDLTVEGSPTYFVNDVLVHNCHALSNSAWQAMLKCIEEPPKYTIFIFCTTDAQKIPATILNRVQVFNFTRIPLDKIKSRLKYICDCEGFTNYEEGIDYIAKLANGGMRDAITYLDKCSTFSKEITINNVLTCLGNFSYDAMFNIVNSIIDGDQGKVMGYVQEIIDQGADMKLFADQFLSFLLDILKFILYKDFRNILIPEYYKDSLIYTTSFENCERYFSYLVDRTLSMKNMLKNDTSPAVTTQVCFSQMTRGC